MSFSVGNPSPIGLVGFALAAMFLGLFEAGLLEPQGKEIVTSYGFWAAGLGQVFTGVIHLLAHNNTFAYLVFTFYGLVWLTICTIWDRVYLYKNYDAHGGGAGGGSPLVGPPGYHGAHSYPDAECLFLCLVGGVSAFLTAIALRHNKALPTALFFVTAGCCLLAAGQYDEHIKKAGGWSLFAAGLTAFYMLVAEITNMEFKREVLPGISRPWARFAPAKPGVAEEKSVEKAVEGTIVKTSTENVG